MKDFLKIVFGSCLGVIVASVVAMILFFSVLGSAISSLSSAFPIGAKEDKRTDVTDNSVLILDLVGELPNQRATDYSGIFGISQKDQKDYTLPELLRALEVAKSNPSVSAIVLRLDYTVLGFASAKELRDALKEVGKPIYAYSDIAYSYGNYYVSSIADKIYANPETTLAITGLSSTVLFEKGLYEKLGINHQVFKVGTFKGAVEPYTRQDLSAENRLQIQTYLNGLWNGTIGEIAAARRIPEAQIQVYADSAYFLDKGERAVQTGLVDSLVYTTDIESVLSKDILGDPNKEINYVRVKDLLPLYEQNGNSDEQVAVIYAEGSVVDINPDDDVNPFVGARSQIDYRVADELADLRDDEDVKAVVLRINSPGGSARMSELITREVKKLKSVKPVVVSMGDMAASGGYYISSNADYIVAEPYTLTGSIGIFGILPEGSKLAQKIGVTSETVSTAKYADFGNLLRPLSQDEQMVMQGYINKGYDLFLTRVSEGRGISKTQVDSIAQGRVWLGKDALERKLVDKIGGLKDAIAEAARRANLQDYTVREVTQTEDFMHKFIELFGTSASAVQMFVTMSPEDIAREKLLYDLRTETGVMAVSLERLSDLKMNNSTSLPVY